MNDIYTLKHIETPRLLIRPIQPGDGKPLHQALISNLEQIQRWMPWAIHTTPEATNAFIEHAIALWQSGRADAFHMVVIEKSSHTIIAASGYNNFSIPVVPLYDIGYWIHADFSGKGYVTEFTNALSRYAFQALGAHRVQINTQVENEKSIAVAKRCGFQHELVMKNECIDCISNQLADSLLMACCDINALPPLEVSWQHGDSMIVDGTNPPSQLTSDTTIQLPELNSERLILRAPTPQDAAPVHQALLASVNEVGPWFSWATPNIQQEHIAAHLDEAIDAARDIQKHNHLFFLAWNAANNNFVGEVWLKIYDWSVMNASVAYWFDSRQTGNGYATEAIRCVMQYAFDKLNAHRLSVDISIQNQPSLRLAKRIGLELEGQLKNRYRNFVTNEICDGLNFVATDQSQIDT